MKPVSADLAQSVERAPFKRVVVGSIPTVGTITRKKFKTADLAQLVERAPFKRVAVGSIPTIGILIKFSMLSFPSGQRG